MGTGTRCVPLSLLWSCSRSAKETDSCRARSADDHARPHLDSLGPAPHNAVVLVTSLSPSSLRTAFGLASPPSSPSSPSSPGGPGWDTIRPRRARPPHGLVVRTLGHMVDLALAGVLLVACAYAARWLWGRYEATRGRRGSGAGGGLRLPFDREGARELELELDSDEESEDELRQERESGRRGGWSLRANRHFEERDEEGTCSSPLFGSRMLVHCNAVRAEEVLYREQPE